MAESSGERRRIRSFVRREGRITPAQQRAFDAHWPRYGLEVGAGPRDFPAVFGRDTPLVLEIGFGNGEQLLHAASLDPARDFVGVEVHRPGVGRLLNGLAAAGVANVRVYCADVVDVLEREFADAALAEVRIFFPDPWPKARHHKRRLVTPAFLGLLARKTAHGGRLHVATDWADYAAAIGTALEQAPEWRLPADASEAAPAARIVTRFEGRGLRLGHAVTDFLRVRD